MSLKKIIYIFVALSLLVITRTCTRFTFIDHPETAEPNSFFDVNMNILIDSESNLGDDEFVYFGVLIPNGWTVKDSISYSGIYEGILTYSPEYTDSVNNHFHSLDTPEGYYWWIAAATIIFNPPDTGAVSLKPRIYTDDQSGQFYIGYVISTDLGSWHDGVTEYDRPISVNAPKSLTVTTTNDNGPGSLREALIQISNGGEIIFDLNYPATIVLDSQLVIKGSVSIKGPGKDSLKISGNNKCRVIGNRERYNDNLFYSFIFAVNISDLTIADGYVTDRPGAGLSLWEINLTMENVNIFGNHVIMDKGGGIYISGDSLNINNVNIYDNIAGGAGAIYSDGLRSIEISNSFICNNKADSVGGIIFNNTYDSNCDAIIKNSTVVENSANKNFGAIRIFNWDAKYFNFNVINTILWNEDNEISIRNSNNLSSVEINLVYSCIIKEEVISNYNISLNLREGNIDSDPMILQQSNGFYALSEDSPCINAGISYYDLGGNVLINLGEDEYIGPAPDIGAYEYDPTTSINEEHYVSNEFTLHQNYPNPFNPTTTIKYTVPSLAGKQGGNYNVTLVVFDVLGREIITLVNKNQKLGNYQQIWDASGQTSGIYFYQLCIGDYKEIKKMVLLK